MTYKLTNEPNVIVRLTDGAHIPADPNNRDYADYLAWLDAGGVTEEANPVPVSLPPISDRQFFQQLAILALISEDDALLACEGKIPASLDALVDTLPQGQRFAARMFLKGATEFKRDHPMTAMLGAAMGWSDEQIDQLWAAAIQL